MGPLGLRRQARKANLKKEATADTSTGQEDRKKGAPAVGTIYCARTKAQDSELPSLFPGFQRAEYFTRIDPCRLHQ